MARTHIVEKARKSPGVCIGCHQVINAGEPYKWVHPRYRTKVVAHKGCNIPLSAVSSSKMVAVWEAVEAFDDSEVTSIPDGLRDLANTAREVGEEYQESADNQREYFPDSEMADENEERAQNLEQWADDLESNADELESAVSELEELQQEQGELQSKENKTEEDTARLEELESEIDEKEEDIRSQAQNIIGEQPE